MLVGAPGPDDNLPLDEDMKPSQGEPPAAAADGINPCVFHERLSAEAQELKAELPLSGRKTE